jgi:transmembrane sensor
MNTDKAPMPNNFNELLESIPEKDQQALLEVWQIAGRSKKPAAKISSVNKADAWDEIQGKINAGRKIRDAKPAPVWMYYLAAAVVVLVSGLVAWQIWFKNISYYAPYGTMADLTLVDDSYIELNNGSRIYWKPGFGKSHRTIYLQGEAYFDVSYADMPFIIQTHNARIEVHGTKFNVRAWPDDFRKETIVALESGAVSVYSLDAENEGITIEPGEISRVTARTAIPERLSEANIEEVVAWRGRNLAYTSQPLISVLRDIERRFDIRITIDSSKREYATRLVSIYYQNPENPEPVLRDIANSLGLAVVIEDDRYRFE